MISLLVDVSNLLWRFFSVTPDLPQLTVAQVAKYAEQFGVDYIFLAVDHGVPAYRKLFCDYKGQRNKKEDKDKRHAFFDFAKIALEELQQIYVSIDVRGFEADDVIGYLSRNLMGEKIIISADSDFLQLLSDTVSVYNGHQFYTPDVFFEKLGFDSTRFVMYRAMAGDRSDNVKGVRGVGVTTAKKIVQKVSTVTELIAYSEASSDRKTHLIAEQRENFYQAFAVIELPAPGICEELGDKLPFLYSEVRESSLSYMEEWSKAEIVKNLQCVKNCKVV
jgi:5'-3' exonuclease